MTFFGFHFSPDHFVIGFQWDPESRALYIFPLPCVGIVIGFEDDGDDGGGAL